MTRTPEILLVEDNPSDVALTRKSFSRAKLPVNLHHVENGKECLAFLRQEEDYAQSPVPDLILLDLNMPIMDGREVLTALVADDALRVIPVVILTTSDSDRDVHEMYDLRCSAYIVKPMDFGTFADSMRRLYEFWFNAVTLPTRTLG
jgi:two-component system response regulator